MAWVQSVGTQKSRTATSALLQTLDRTEMLARRPLKNVCKIRTFVRSFGLSHKAQQCLEKKTRNHSATTRPTLHRGEQRHANVGCVGRQKGISAVSNARFGQVSRACVVVHSGCATFRFSIPSKQKSFRFAVSRCACFCLGETRAPRCRVMKLFVSSAARSTGGNSAAVEGVPLDKTSSFTESRKNRLHSWTPVARMPRVAGARFVDADQISQILVPCPSALTLLVAVKVILADVHTACNVRILLVRTLFLINRY